MNKGIIVTSFGTTYEETRIKCIESIENRIKDEFKEYKVVRAFTSRMVINKLRKRDSYLVDTPTEAMEKLFNEGIKDIFIQPLLIIEGLEYEKILREARDFIKVNNCNISIGKPLLSHEDDYNKVANVLNLEDAVVLMGHGSEHKTDISYEKLELKFRQDNKNVFIGTVEGRKTLDDILEELNEKSIEKVNLRPFMLVAGDHAINDMASSDEDSWKSILERNGLKVQVQIQGLGEIEGIQDIFINHLKDVL